MWTSISPTSPGIRTSRVTYSDPGSPNLVASAVNPTRIIYHKRSKTLELTYSDSSATLPAELLRVYSPSAEVRGHAESERVLQTGKKRVGVREIVPVGNYAIRIVFDDGHDTGIYSWSFLRDLAAHRERYWQRYLDDLKERNASRLPTIPVGQWTPPAKP